jgi:hypothetical protein
MFSGRPETGKLLVRRRCFRSAGGDGDNGAHEAKVLDHAVRDVDTGRAALM